MSISATPLTGNIGALIEGVDLRRPIDDESYSAIHKALLDHLVLFFRDQDITNEQHIAFARRFGELHIHPLAPNLGPEYPEIIPLDTTNVKRPVEWHSDATFEAQPPLGSVLRAFEVPSVGGDTVFASMYAAYDALTPTMQHVLEPLRAVHDSTGAFGAGGRNGSYTTDTRASAQRQALHPIIRTHPETGRRSLFVNWQFTTHIEGMSANESNALLNFLLTHVQQATFQVRWSWKPHSIAFWDNRCTQHYVAADYQGAGRRFMHRVTVLGDTPV